jgi:hypothetical protein
MLVYIPTNMSVFVYTMHNYTTLALYMSVLYANPRTTPYWGGGGGGGGVNRFSDRLIPPKKLF